MFSIFVEGDSKWDNIMIVIVIISCKNYGQNENGESRKQKEIKEIYTVIINRMQKYNDKKILVYKIPAFSPINTNNFDRIRGGMKYFNQEVKECIDNYNDISDISDSELVMKKYMKLSDTDDKYQLSKIGFNGDMEYAVLYEIDNTVSDLGRSSYIFLRKVNEKWNIESEIDLY
jgi:hypothetical protein